VSPPAKCRPPRRGRLGKRMGWLMGGTPPHPSRSSRQFAHGVGDFERRTASQRRPVARRSSERATGCCPCGTDKARNRAPGSRGPPTACPPSSPGTSPESPAAPASAHAPARAGPRSRRPALLGGAGMRQGERLIGKALDVPLRREVDQLRPDTGRDCLSGRPRRHSGVFAPDPGSDDSVAAEELDRVGRKRNHAEILRRQRKLRQRQRRRRSCKARAWTTR
jgi:hypothetical protein